MRAKSIGSFLLLAACLLPCGALPLGRAVSSMVDELASAYLAEGRAYSKVGVAVPPIADESRLAARHEVGAAVGALVESAIDESLVFALVDRRVLAASLDEIELALSRPAGSAALRAGLLEEIEYLVAGRVFEEGDRFRIALRLVDAATLAEVASAESSFPASELAAYGDETAKPFGFAGPYGSLEWAATNPGFGELAASAGFSATIPLGRTVYARLGIDCVYSEGDLGVAKVAEEWDFPGAASGRSRVRAALATLGTGAIVQLSGRAYLHFGAELGLGLDERSSRRYEAGAAEKVAFDNPEICFGYGLSAGLALRVLDALVLDLQLGAFGRTYNLVSNDATSSLDEKSGTGGCLYLPLRLSLAYPFR